MNYLQKLEDNELILLTMVHGMFDYQDTASLPHHDLDILFPKLARVQKCSYNFKRSLINLVNGHTTKEKQQ